MHRNENGAILIFDEIHLKDCRDEFLQYIDTINPKYFFESFKVQGLIELVVLKEV